MKPASRCSARRRAGGFTLIDVLVLIVLLGTVAGSMTVLFSRLAAQSADTMRERQMLALANALLAEVRMMPMTYCDPQDANVLTAGSSAACAATAEGLGPEPGETRYNAADRFDNVSDYHGFASPGAGCPGGICDIAGNLLNPAGSPLAGCSTTITTTPQAMPGIAALDANGRPQALRIAVRLRCPSRVDTVVEAVRLRHDPNRP